MSDRGPGPEAAAPVGFGRGLQAAYGEGRGVPGAARRARRSGGGPLGRGPGLPRANIGRSARQAGAGAGPGDPGP